MILQFTLPILFLLICGMVSVGLTILAWNNRSLPMAKLFVMLMAAETVWIFGSAFELMSTDLSLVLFFNNIEYPAMMMVMISWIFIALAHTGREHYLTTKTIPLFFIVPALVCIFVVTNPWHYLYYTGFHPVVVGGITVWVYEHGPLFWVMFAYNYAVGIAALVLTAHQLTSRNDLYRRQTLLLLGAASIPVLFNLAYVFRINPFPEYDLTQIAFLLTGLVLGVGLLRYQLFSAAPVAYSRVFATIHDGVIVINSQFRVVDLNPAAERITATKAHQVVGRDLVSLVPEVSAILDTTVPVQGIWEGEILLNGEDQPRYYDVLCTPLEERGTGSAGYLCIFRNVTARKEAELSLVTANKKINLLTKITRHDLENQLMIMYGYIGLLKKSPLSSAQQEYLTRQEAAVNVMREHVEFTRKYQQLGAQAPVWQQADAVIRKAKSQVFLNTVSFTCDVEPVEILADPMLERVFHNLLDNAVRYGGDSLTRISVTSHRDGAAFVVVIADDGAGISKDDRPRLFEQGFGKHTGLGLFLSREILAITDITIDQTGTPGRGARFEIRVPHGKFRHAL